MKVRLILVFPPLTHPETKVWDVGPLLRLGRGGGKAEYRAGWPEAKVILNISRVHFFFRTERISCKPQRTKEIWSENWRQKLLHCSSENMAAASLHMWMYPPAPPAAAFSQILLIWENVGCWTVWRASTYVAGQPSQPAFVRSLAILNQQMHKILNVS